MPKELLTDNPSIPWLRAVWLWDGMPWRDTRPAKPGWLVPRRLSIAPLRWRFTQRFRNFRIMLDGLIETGIFQSGPVPQRGGSRSSRTRGGMRWTLMALKTNALEADGEVVWS
jgi:hypothetical protein